LFVFNNIPALVLIFLFFVVEVSLRTTFCPNLNDILSLLGWGKESWDWSDGVHMGKILRAAVRRPSALKTTPEARVCQEKSCPSSFPRAQTWGRSPMTPYREPPLLHVKFCPAGRDDRI
jgi:hypothetical protein